MPLSKKTTCKHDHLEPTLGGFFCPECRRRFDTAAATDARSVLRKAATDTTAVLHAILPRLVRLEHEFEQMDPILQELVLKDLNYSRCSTLDCRAFFPKDPGNLVGGLPYCDLCYPREHQSYLNKLKRDDEPAMEEEKSLATAEREFGELPDATTANKAVPAMPPVIGPGGRWEGPDRACQAWGCANTFPINGGNEIDGKRLCDRCCEKELGNVECRSAPMWAWDIIDECLGLDAVSNASDKELRDSVQRAIDAMTVETAWNSNVAGKES